MLTTGLLALIACARAPEPTAASELGPARTISPETPLTPPSARESPAFEPAAAAAAQARSEPSVSAARAQKSPVQALNQMLTAQALLVTLLFAPLSKDGSEAPLASVDNPPPRTR